MKNNFCSIKRVNGKLFYSYFDPLSDVQVFYDESGKPLEIGQPEVPGTDESDQGISFIPLNDVNPLGLIASHLRRCIYLRNDAEYLALSAFCILSYSVDLFDRIPYLSIQGLKGSGKTTLMTVMKSIVYQPLFLSETTNAALFRLIDSRRPTLFLDEVESLNKRGSANEQIFQVLNSGYQKDGLVTRVSGNKVLHFQTYGLKVMAGINKLFSTLEDRCILLELVKPPDSTELERMSVGDPNDIQELINNILSGLMSSQERIMEYVSNPSMLCIDERIRNRDFDKWFPLLLIAKTFSTESDDYFSLVQNYALQQISVRKQEDAHTPENMCRAIVRDFVADNSEKSVIPDRNDFYFRAEMIQKIIAANDQYNTYRTKADYTLTLKRLGIESVRKRKEGRPPETMYKIPKSFIQ